MVSLSLGQACLTCCQTGPHPYLYVHLDRLTNELNLDMTCLPSLTREIIRVIVGEAPLERPKMKNRDPSLP